MNGSLRDQLRSAGFVGRPLKPKQKPPERPQPKLKLESKRPFTAVEKLMARIAEALERGPLSELELWEAASRNCPADQWTSAKEE